MSFSFLLRPSVIAPVTLNLSLYCAILNAFSSRKKKWPFLPAKSNTHYSEHHSTNKKSNSTEVFLYISAISNLVDTCFFLLFLPSTFHYFHYSSSGYLIFRGFSRHKILHTHTHTTLS